MAGECHGTVLARRLRSVPWHDGTVKASSKPKKLRAKKSSKAASRKAVPRRAPAKKTAAATKSASTMVARRADYGAPIDGFFAKQPPNLRAILDELRALVEESVPDAIASIKWGMPNFSIGKSMVCALAGFKSHVNLIVAGPPEIFDDPEGRLEGDAKGGRHMKLRALEDVPHDAVRRWVRAAAKNARPR
jgi:hypothetical protein